MQKFIITDGSSFVSNKKKNHRISANPTLAVEFTYREAKNALTNDVSLKKFYVEGVDDRTIIQHDEVVRNNSKDINPQAKADGLIKNIGDLVDEICKFTIPSQKTLNIYMDELIDELAHCDKILSEIRHWIKENKAPAPMRSIIFDYQQKYEIRRSEVKEKMRYIQVFLDLYSKKIDFNALNKTLKDAKSKPYTPDTPIYEELNTLLKKTRRKKKNKTEEECVCNEV